jgi:hypothetical protein
MGYGAGAFLVVVGLVLALAVQDSVEGVDLQLAGWICAGVGLLLLVLTAATLNRGRRASGSSTTIHPDGSQTVRQSRTEA